MPSLPVQRRVWHLSLSLAIYIFFVVVVVVVVTVGSETIGDKDTIVLYLEQVGYL